MKNLIIILFFGSCLNIFSQWEISNGPYGNSIVWNTVQINDTIIANFRRNFFVTYDNGKSWNDFNNNLEELMFNRDNASNKIFTGIHNIKNIDGVLYAGTSTGLYKSTDFARTWSASDYSMYDNSSKFNDCYDIIGYNDSLLAIYKSSNKSDMFYSTNSGNTWEKFENDSISSKLSGKQLIAHKNDIIYIADSEILIKYNYRKDNAEYIELDFVPYNVMYVSDDKIIIGTEYDGLFISYDDGYNWNKAIQSLNINDCAIKGDTIIVASKDGGLFYSYDNGTNFDQVEFTRPLSINLINDVAYAGSSNGMFSSTDYGKSWDAEVMNTIKIPHKDLFADNNTIYTASSTNGMYQTKNYGENWEIINSDFTFKTEFFSKIFAKDNIIIGGTYNGIFISIDNGQTFDKYQGVLELSSALIKDITSYKDTLLIGTNNNAFYSTNNGKNWDILNNYRFSLFFKINDDLYAFNNSDKSVYIKNKNISDWKKITNEINTDGLDIELFFIIDSDIYVATKKEFVIYDINLSNREEIRITDEETEIGSIYNYGNNIIAGVNYNGVFISTDKGKMWQKFNDGLKYPTTSTYDDILILNNTIYLATNKGIYKGDLADFNITGVEETETVNMFYYTLPSPNPAKTEVRSMLYWDKNINLSEKDIKVYNINGVEVGRKEDITLEKETIYKGRLIWNCTNVPDGVYLIQISHGDRKQTIKVMVRK